MQAENLIPAAPASGPPAAVDAREDPHPMIDIEQTIAASRNPDTVGWLLDRVLVCARPMWSSWLGHVYATTDNTGVTPIRRG